MQEFVSTSEEETIALGRDMGGVCEGGEVFLLQGDLGTGKTCLSKGIALGLNVKDQVNSPTFNIMKVYTAKRSNVKNFCHIDAYRLNQETNLENIGIDEYLAKANTVCVIEWPENIFSKGKMTRFKVIKMKMLDETKRLIQIY